MNGSRHRHAKKARGEYGEVRRPGSFTDSSSDDNNDSGEFSESVPAFMDDIRIAELLELDSRPTFIIDLHESEKETNGRMNVIWSNKSLRFFDELRAVIYTETFFMPSLSSPTLLQESKAAAVADFKAWATSVPNFDSAVDGYRPRHTFRGMLWTSSTLRGRWRVISASQVPRQPKPSHGTPRTSRSNSRTGSSITSSSFMTGTESAIESAMAEDELHKQLADSESKFRVLTELNPVGMYYLNPEGDILYCNDTWYEITGHPRGLEGEMSFMNVLAEVDHPLMAKEWDILTTQRARRIFELRLRNPWKHPTTGELKQKWILASCDQEFDEDGNLKTIMGCITDISAQKHAEEDALKRVHLIEEIALRTEEAARHAKNFQQMAELAPCGMFTFDPKGKITWANSQWYEMTGHSRSAEEHTPMSFLKLIEPQDRDAFEAEWQKLMMKEEVSLELRLKKPWIRQESNGDIRDAKWILFLALPQLDDQGNLVSVFGCSTDVSGFKFTENVQRMNRLEAEEAKRQQESFIDMTSHEMRNPLGAITLLADGIVNSLQDYQASENKTAALSQELLEDNLDAAQTIASCAQYQKRIIDDVLTLSKLKAAMLHVTPVQIEVEATVRGALKMVHSELQTHDIKMTFVVEPCYVQSNIDWVQCDPVRLQQIFINLLTNAIKFTRTEDKREITVTLGASVGRPPRDIAPDIQWFPSKDFGPAKKDLTLAPEWGTGDHVYLYFSVKDTGRGLSEDEKTRLFHRFSQASPKTHVQYGGSGLGLFISRELTELQGGEIGVASKAGEGSTFAFYIKARRSTGAQSELGGPQSSSGLRAPLGKSHLPGTLSRPRCNYHILLVEDNLINQKVLSKQLRGTGAVVHVANHGGEALDFLSKTALWNDGPGTEQKMELSLILMDLEMPIMDGLACTRRIRDLEREGKVVGHVPVIAVTANTRMEQIETAMDAGMDDIVAKPFHIPELMQKMDQSMQAQAQAQN